MTHQISTQAEAAREAVRQQGGQFGAQVRRDNDAPLSSDGLRRVEQANGTILYVRGDSDDNMLHNESGPALVRLDGSRGWFIDGLLHRTDGPAIEHRDGRVEFWVDGEKVDQEDFPLHPAVIEDIVDRGIEEPESFVSYDSNRASEVTTVGSAINERFPDTYIDLISDSSGRIEDAVIFVRVAEDQIPGGVDLSLSRELDEWSTDNSLFGREQAIATVTQVLTYREQLLNKARDLGIA